MVQSIDDNDFLNQLYSLLDNQRNFEEGKLVNMLTAEEKTETYKSLSEVDKNENLVDHSEAMQEIRKKLGWD